MNYAQAKEIAAEVTPALIVDPEVPGQPHICVRRTAKGAPFSITLVTTDDAAADVKTLKDALDAANVTLGR